MKCLDCKTSERLVNFRPWALVCDQKLVPTTFKVPSAGIAQQGLSSVNADKTLVPKKKKKEKKKDLLTSGISSMKRMTDITLKLPRPLFLLHSQQVSASKTCESLDTFDPRSC